MAVLAHYVWVGPAKGASDPMRGMDTVGAELVAKYRPQQPIAFWCLSSQEAVYKARFFDKKNITIRCIEPYIMEKEGVNGEYYQFVSALLSRAKTLLTSPDQRKRSTAVYEWVLIKDSFFYWLAQHVHQDSVLLDSSIMPEPTADQSIDVFSDLKKFSASFVTGIGCDNPDPWLMWVKHTDAEKLAAKQRFVEYFTKVKSLMGGCLDPAEYGNSQPNREQICDQFALSSQNAAPLLAPDTGKYGRQVAGMVKVYMGTHRDPWLGTLKHWLFRLLESHVTVGLDYLIHANGFNPDQRLPYATSRGDAQQHLSLIELATRQMNQSLQVVKKTEAGKNKAEAAVDYREWKSDPSFLANESYKSVMSFQLQDVLRDKKEYKDCKFVRMGNVQWQRYCNDIFVGEVTIDREYKIAEIRAKQLGMLLACRSSGAQPLVDAVSCKVPKIVTSSLVGAIVHDVVKNKDYECFFASLNSLVNTVLGFKGVAPCDVSTQDKCVAQCISSYQKSWTKPHFKVIEVMVDTIKQEGLPSGHNRDRFSRSMRRFISQVPAFFNHAYKTTCQQAIERCLDRMQTRLQRTPKP